MNPFNLFLRFTLELLVLGITAFWGYKQTHGWVSNIIAVFIPIVLAIIWGTFAVPNDPSRSGNAPIVVSGLIRLVIELSFFGFGVWALYNLNYTKAGLALLILVMFHYIVSYQRVIWLIKQ